MMASFVMTSPSTSPPFATSTWRPARTVPTTVPSIFTTPSATMSPSTRMPAPMIESPASDSGAPCPFSVKIAMSILLFHDSERVERPSVTADFEVQVRSRGSPRGSGQRDHLPCLHRVSLAYQQPRGMPVHRLIPLGMAQEHEQTVGGIDARGRDHPPAGRAYRRALGHRDGDHEGPPLACVERPHRHPILRRVEIAIRVNDDRHAAVLHPSNGAPRKTSSRRARSSFE